MQAYLDEAAVSEFFGYAFSLVENNEPEGSDALDSIQIMIRIFSVVRQSDIYRLPPAIKRFLYNTGIERLNTDMESFPLSCQICCERTGICRAAFFSMQNKLFTDLVFLCSTSSVSGYADAPGSNLLDSFFSKATSDMSKNCKCLFSNSKSSTVVNMVPVKTSSAQFEAGASKDWRKKMTEIMTQNAQNSSTLVIKKVEEICRDLEHRCHNIEAPLRDVIEERDQLALEVEALKRHKRELEIEVDQSSHAISTFQQDITRLENQAQGASVRTQDLATQLVAAQNELEKEKQDSQDSVLSERERARFRELDLMATLTERDDQLEELQNELHKRLSENEKLRETVDTISKKNISTSETVVLLKHEAEELQRSLGEKMSENKRMEAQITSLLSDKERICCERDSLQDKVRNFHVTFYMILMHVELQLESEILESNRLRIALREEEESNQSKIVMLEQQYQSEISRLTAQVRLKICLQTAFNSLVRRCRRPPDLQKKLMY